jgi:hypothetical protein
LADEPTDKITQAKPTRGTVTLSFPHFRKNYRVHAMIRIFRNWDIRMAFITYTINKSFYTIQNI